MQTTEVCPLFVLYANIIFRCLKRISNVHKCAPFQYAELQHLNKINVTFAPVSAYNEVEALELVLVKP